MLARTSIVDAEIAAQVSKDLCRAGMKFNMIPYEVYLKAGEVVVEATQPVAAPAADRKRPRESEGDGEEDSPPAKRRCSVQ